MRTQSLSPVKPPPRPHEAGMSPCLSWTQPGLGWGLVPHTGCREAPWSVTVGRGRLGAYMLTLTEGRPLPACWRGPQKGHLSCPGLQSARWKMEKTRFQLITLPSRPALCVPGWDGDERSSGPIKTGEMTNEHIYRTNSQTQRTGLQLPRGPEGWEGLGVWG